MKLKAGMEKEYQEYYDNNTKDGYSKGVVDFTQRWADLMEDWMGQGANIADIAKRASHEADTEGLTGFMYGCAVQALAHFWEHGEELRRWHNIDTQIGTEGEKANESGGVLNPAILTVNS